MCRFYWHYLGAKHSPYHRDRVIINSFKVFYWALIRCQSDKCTLSSFSLVVLAICCDEALNAEDKNKMARTSVREKVDSVQVTSKPQRVTLRLDQHTMDRVRNAVYWLPGITLNSLIEQAVRIYITEVERNKNKPRLGNLWVMWRASARRFHEESA